MERFYDRGMYLLFCRANNFAYLFFSYRSPDFSGRFRNKVFRRFVLSYDFFEKSRLAGRICEPAVAGASQKGKNKDNATIFAGLFGKVQISLLFFAEEQKKM